MKTGIERISAERKRQIEDEGWDSEHDKNNDDFQLVKAAACYALPEFIRDKENTLNGILIELWPWDSGWWKPTPGDRIRELEKAGALIAAEIDRIQEP